MIGEGGVRYIGLGLVSGPGRGAWVSLRLWRRGIMSRKYMLCHDSCRWQLVWHGTGLARCSGSDSKAKIVQ